MLYLAIFILFLIIILSILFIVRIYIILEYEVIGLNDYIKLTFSALGGLIKYEYKIKDRLHRISEKKEAKSTEADGILNKLRNLHKVYELMEKLKVYLKKKLWLNEVKLEIDIGTGDAYYTGIISGMLWAAAGVFTSIIANTFTTLKNRVCVRPNFMEKKFKAELYCIFSIKTVHIIVVVIKVLLHRLKNKNLKGGVINGRTSNRRSDDDGDAKH
ncbi:MAG: DUF2953 domain-containing protein [Clostridia bacterium]|nr:DUF2953 domain-containing protein [Clostridia bacterium]